MSDQAKYAKIFDQSIFMQICPSLANGTMCRYVCLSKCTNDNIPSKGVWGHSGQGDHLREIFWAELEISVNI